METSDSYIMASDVAKTIGMMTEGTNKAVGQGTAVPLEDVHPFDLLQYQEAFHELGVRDLPETVADTKLQSLKKDLYKLKNRFPEGTRVMLAAFPCDANGRLYSEDELKNYDFLKTLFIDAKTGLSSGYGSWSSGHSKLLPKEIQDKCSFTVHYGSSAPYADEKDFEQFSSQYKAAFLALKEILS